MEVGEGATYMPWHHAEFFLFILFILLKRVDKSDLKVLFRFVAVFVSLSVCLVVVIVVVVFVFVAFHRRLLPKSPDGQ